MRGKEVDASPKQNKEPSFLRSYEGPEDRQDSQKVAIDRMCIGTGSIFWAETSADEMTHTSLEASDHSSSPMADERIELRSSLRASQSSVAKSLHRQHDRLKTAFNVLRVRLVKAVVRTPKTPKRDSGDQKRRDTFEKRRLS